MILFFYNLLLVIILVISAPWWLFRMATTAKYREGLYDRLGLVRPLKGGNGRPVIWIHAVSVGEVLAVSRLVNTLDAVLPDHFIVVSTTTRTGQDLARERFGSNRVFYFPLDLFWAVRAYLNARSPVLFVLTETEFWPNLLNRCFKLGVPVVVVNARISDRSWPRYRWLRRLWQPILGRLTAVLAQSELDAERLRALGCKRVTVAGNLKFDVRSGRDSAAVKLMEELRGDLRLLVAGSTLDGEEVALLEAWRHLLAKEPLLGMVLAPRHPERFAAVAELLNRSGFPWRRRSAMGKNRLVPGEVVLLDSMGELATVYSLASVAFVGGSLEPAGGHNPLEPAQFGVPVVMGGHYANFRAVVDAMRAQHAIVITDSGGLSAAIASLLGDEIAGRQVGESGRKVFEQHAGATARTVSVIREIAQARERV